MALGWNLDFSLIWLGLLAREWQSNFLKQSSHKMHRVTRSLCTNIQKELESAVTSEEKAADGGAGSSGKETQCTGLNYLEFEPHVSVACGKITGNISNFFRAPFGCCVENKMIHNKRKQKGRKQTGAIIQARGLMAQATGRVAAAGNMVIYTMYFQARAQRTYVEMREGGGVRDDAKVVACSHVPFAERELTRGGTGWGGREAHSPTSGRDVDEAM